MGQTEDGAVEIRGTMIKPKEVGLYAARIIPQNNVTKELAVVGPAAMDYDKDSGAFTVTLKTQGMENLFFCADDPKFLELYVQTRQVDKIKYGTEADANERVNVKHLQLSCRLPMDYFPDPRVVIEDDADRQKFDREIAEKAKRVEEERLVQVAAQLARKEERARKKEEFLAAKMNADEGDDGDDMSGSDKGSKSGSGHTPQGGSSKHRSGSHDSGSQDNSEMNDDDEFGENEEDEDYDGGVGDLPTAPEMQ